MRAPQEGLISMQPEERSMQRLAVLFAVAIALPTALSAQTRPPCASARCFTMARPRPVPPSARERAGSPR